MRRVQVFRVSRTTWVRWNDGTLRLALVMCAAGCDLVDEIAFPGCPVGLSDGT